MLIAVTPLSKGEKGKCGLSLCPYVWGAEAIHTYFVNGPLTNAHRADQTTHTWSISMIKAQGDEKRRSRPRWQSPTFTVGHEGVVGGELRDMGAKRKDG